ncbi:MAG: LemA family protein [Pseudomonadota bacterium]|nr:LemA family protein [Pseudomonadota bacterium]
MSHFPLWFWLLLALGLFWLVGAYNRLVRLRAAVGKAFAALDEQLLRQLVWVQASLPASMRGGAGTSPGELQDEVTAAWARLQAASDQFAVTLAQARARPLDAPGMASMVLAHEAMRTAWNGALADAMPPDAVPSAERLQARWMRLLHQAIPLRTAFNDAASAYNQAIAQFPTVLLARLVGFRPAGSLTRLAEGR